jgi:D-alanine-D-alanine ligase
VLAALEQAGLNVVESDITPTDMIILEDRTIDVFFIALHGPFGEDGQLQGILQRRGLVYTGSGPRASRLAMDKWASKALFRRAGVAAPEAVRVFPRMESAKLEEQIRRLGGPVVVKPVSQGSSVGITISSEPGQAVEMAQNCLEQFGDCMVERYIPGREITVGVLGRRALPVIEIRSSRGFYDYQAKYLDDATEFLFDTIEDQELVGRIEQAALACFECLGCRHFGRVDFILGTGGVAYALEVNTIPGFTTHSLLPKAAAKVGIGMSELCATIVQAAAQETTAAKR